MKRASKLANTPLQATSGTDVVPIFNSVRLYFVRSSWAFGAGRGVSAAGALRSAPPRCEAGKRAQRFLADKMKRLISSVTW